MRAAFLDTVGMLAVWDRSDQWHETASPVFAQLLGEGWGIFSTTFILAECGNAALPLEVRQVRINRSASAAGNQPAVRGMAERGGAIPRGALAPQEGKNVDPYLTSVELYGIVYLYNPPAKSLQPPPAVVPPAGTAGPVGGLNAKAGAG